MSSAPPASSSSSEATHPTRSGADVPGADVLGADVLDDAERRRRGEAARTRVEELAAAGVVGVGLVWVDTSGVTRTKAIPLAKLPSAAQWGIGASPVFDAFLSDDSIVAGRFAGGPVGDLRLHPDLDGLVVLTEQPGWALAPVDRYAQDGEAHPNDARSAARRAEAALAAAGYGAHVAFEFEWTLSDTADGFHPSVSGPAYGYTRLSERSDYLRDVLIALEHQGVVVEQIHPEYAAGQFEVSVAPQAPVAAADTAVLVRETVRATSARHGMHTSFSPKVLADGVGNGGHVHLSLWDGERNLYSGGDRAYGMTATAESFSAGILHRLPALLAIGAPSPASYLRLIPHHWAGAFCAWGHENRETALRLVVGSPGNAGRAANLEVKAFDQAANPYLVVAALLAAGLGGIAEYDRLPAACDVDPASLSDEELAARGITALPSTLGAATDAFEADPVLGAFFGQRFAATIADVRRGEIALHAESTPEQIAAALRWTF